MKDAVNNHLLKLALLGVGIGLAGAARADLAGGMAALEAGRCADAIKALTPAARKGDAAAQKALGDAYSDTGKCDDRRAGEGGGTEAEPWYLLAARAGNVDAQRRLIDLYEYAPRDSNPEQATLWMGKVAALGGASDLSRLATRHERAEGVPYDRVLAYAFNLLASRRAGKEDGGEQAANLAREANEMSPEQLAEAERLAAAWKPGKPLPAASETGRRDPRDWYKAAAEAGDLEAAHKAGTLYWKFNYGMTVDPGQAAFWLRKAAQGGIADAQYQLGQLYAMGYGVPKDYVLAYVLQTLGAKGGKEADAQADAWDEALTTQQLEEGRALLAAWKKGGAFPEATRHGLQRKVNYVDDAEGKLEATPDVLALFQAASEGDEAEFVRLLAKIGDINAYMVGHEKLLHALLLPADSLRKEAAAWKEARKDARDTVHWQAQQARHAALMPAKTRMLALALQRGAAINEGTQRGNAGPLHLATMFGTPEMVRLLLKHGADPAQYGGANRHTAPLEFALEQGEYALGLPELISPQQRTANIMALLAAGAPRPYIRLDIADARKKDAEPRMDRPFADYLLWPNLVALTRGTEVLDAMLKTGTKPAEDDEGKTIFDYAAEAGNADAVDWLKQRVPRYGKEKQDRWLNAAMLAMYSIGPGRDDVLGRLLSKDMDWSTSGPQREDHGRSYRSLYGGSERIEDGTLLNHATRARRAEWIGKLAALGAPVGKGGSVQDLGDAVRDGDVELVKILLGQGADPLSVANPYSDTPPALSLALAAPEGKDEMLDLLLDHIVKVDKKTLAGVRPSPLETLLAAPGKIDMARVRKLLDAGASVQGWGRNAVAAAFAAPDRGLATLLIKRGLLDETAEDGAAPDAAEPRFVFVAIDEGRADLLPAILAHGEDPNRRGTKTGGGAQPNAVDYAISQGNVEALEALRAHGGQIDMAGGQPWGTALDRAVASLNPDMLRVVSKDYALPLQQACLPSKAQLAKVVLEAPPGYWTLLREHGFGQGEACAGMQERLVLHLSGRPDVLLAGWLGQQLVERLPQLGQRRERFGADTWAAIAAGKNDQLDGLLAKAGWKAPALTPATDDTPRQRDKAADLALKPKLAGHYYLSGGGEMGAELLLRPNGKFQYSMAYGAVDEYAQGSWTVWNKQVIFRSEAATAQPGSMSPSADAPVAGLPAGQLLVDLRHDGKSIPGFKVAVLGDTPVKSDGRTGNTGWRTVFNGPVRQIAVSHPEINANKWMVYEVPPADALRGSYRLDFQPRARAPAAFNFTFDVRNGKLVLDRGGREMLFEKQ